MVQLGAGTALVNERFRQGISEKAASHSVEETLWRIDEVATARARIEQNVPPALALEALLVALSGRVPAEPAEL